jgi:triphosphoribosyl-dephospho-CoA synthetase
MQRDSIERKNRLHDSFIAALDVLDAEHREPDRWEEECLSYALGAMACGMYLVAEVELAAFKRPVDERSPEVTAALASKPARFTKEMLRHGLDYVQQRYGQIRAVDDVPPALAAGQRAFQSSLVAPSR